MTEEQFSLFFIQRFKGKVLFNQPMSEYTSFRIGGPADVMAFPQDEGDLRDLMVFAQTKHFSFHLLGAGRNILVRDGGVRGVVINLSKCLKEIKDLGGRVRLVGARSCINRDRSPSTGPGFSRQIRTGPHRPM